jgi:predicted AAA+ superfamily ATPase
MIQRVIFNVLNNSLFKGKTLLIFGPRQSGKTTLLELLARETDEKTLLMNCDEPDVRKSLTDATSVQLKKLIGNARIVMIDEAQRVKNAGVTLKLIHDNLRNVQLIATGSASLELSGELQEPLTGRATELLLLPLSTEELVCHSDVLSEKRSLESRMLFGMYPAVINEPGEEKKNLNSLSGNFLYKDIFTFQDVRKPEIIENLLEALALQTGSEVSYHELGNELGIDQVTVRRYIDLLEKSYIIFRLRAFSRNVRNEIRKSRKIYFYDNGIRNALISNFRQVNLRTDRGALWENFMVSERIKYLNNHQIDCRRYFWRTTQQQEIDYIEEHDGSLAAYEFKWSGKKTNKLPLTFARSYPLATSTMITPDSYLDFLTG